ncbi:MAG: pilus assembly protein TadG-related protein [Pseudomonadota bacterium]
MGMPNSSRKSFLRSLLHDTSANTIVISAAAMIPLVGMVGGAVDSSRYYMTASRLQAACDAGALAARRAMADKTFTSVHEGIGNNFFDQNYPDGTFGLENLSRNYSGLADGTVKGTATGDLPTSLMGVFGYDEFNITVNCTAEINISNTDIMFVLDVTGSMNCPDDGSSCPSGNNNNTEVANSRIVGLRSAVLNFYDTVNTATSPSAQVRYGIVPYASNVNVGGSIPTSYMANSHTYQSRVAEYKSEEVVIQEGNGVEVGDEIVISEEEELMPRNLSWWGSSEQWRYRWDNEPGDPDERADWAYDECNDRDGTYTVGNETWEVLTDHYVLEYFDGGNANRRAACRGVIRKTREATQDDVVEDITETQYVFDRYVYRPIDLASPPDNNRDGSTDVPGKPSWAGITLANLYDDNQIQMPVGSQGAMSTITWDGCVEEADTVATASFNPIPLGANDLDINLVPSTDAERWKPVLRNVAWKREVWNSSTETNDNTTSWLYQTWDESRPSYSCPAAAFRLTDITRSALETYVNNLQGRSNTYHDIGMIWGSRFISPRGIFSADNASAPNGDAIARHIVFMTDGILATNVEVYGTYGTEWWDRRVTDNGTNGQASPRHAARFQAACRAAKNENISVWVVAFGTTLTQNLKDCASPGRAYAATDSASLNSAFQEIAQKIAALRLTS